MTIINSDDAASNYHSSDEDEVPALRGNPMLNSYEEYVEDELSGYEHSEQLFSQIFHSHITETLPQSVGLEIDDRSHSPTPNLSPVGLSPFSRTMLSPIPHSEHHPKLGDEDGVSWSDEKPESIFLSSSLHSISPSLIFSPFELAGKKDHEDDSSGHLSDSLEFQLSPFDDERCNLTPIASPQYSPIQSRSSQDGEPLRDQYLKCSPTYSPHPNDPYKTPPYSPSRSPEVKVRSKRRLDYSPDVSRKRQKVPTKPLNVQLEEYIQKIEKYTLFTPNESNSQEVVNSIAAGYAKLQKEFKSDPSNVNLIITSLFKNEAYCHLFFQYLTHGSLEISIIRDIVEDILEWTNLRDPNFFGGYRSHRMNFPSSFSIQPLLKTKALTSLLKSLISSRALLSYKGDIQPIIGKVAFQLAYLNESCGSQRLIRHMHTELSTLYLTESFHAYLVGLDLNESGWTNTIIESLYSLILSQEMGYSTLGKILSESSNKEKILLTCFRYINLCSNGSGMFVSIKQHIPFFKTFLQRVATNKPYLLKNAALVSPLETLTALAYIGIIPPKVEIESRDQKIVSQVISLLQENLELELHLSRSYRNFSVESLEIALALLAGTDYLYPYLFASYDECFIIDSINEKYFNSLNADLEIQDFFLSSWLENQKYRQFQWIEHIRNYSQSIEDFKNKPFIKLIISEMTLFLNRSQDTKSAVFTDENFASFIESITLLEENDRTLFLNCLIENVFSEPDQLNILVELISSFKSTKVIEYLWFSMSDEAKSGVLTSLCEKCDDLTRYMYAFIPATEKQFITKFKGVIELSDTLMEVIIDKILNLKNDKYIQFIKELLSET